MKLHWNLHMIIMPINLFQRLQVFWCCQGTAWSAWAVWAGASGTTSTHEGRPHEARGRWLLWVQVRAWSTWTQTTMGTGESTKHADADYYVYRWEHEALGRRLLWVQVRAWSTWTQTTMGTGESCRHNPRGLWRLWHKVIFAIFLVSFLGQKCR